MISHKLYLNKIDIIYIKKITNTGGNIKHTIQRYYNTVCVVDSIH